MPSGQLQILPRNVFLFGEGEEWGEERIKKGSHHNVKDSDHIQWRGKYGTHDFNRWFLQAIIGWQHLAVKKADKC